MPDSQDDLLREIRSLNLHVKELADHLTISSHAMSRIRVISVVSLVLGLVVTLFSAISFLNYRDLRSGQLTLCAARNVTMEGNRSLWLYVLTSAANDKSGVTRSKEFYRNIQSYVDEIHVPENCADLKSGYMPKPPPKPPAMNDTGG